MYKYFDAIFTDCFIERIKKRSVTNVIVGDSLSYSNNQNFSTPDQDNDWSEGDNCATRYRTAGWFRSCFLANPNGPYTDSEKIASHGYLTWQRWKMSWISLKAMQLMIRPRA